MTAPLSEVTITSTYKNKDGQRILLPSRMAHCTPDMEAAIRAVSAEVEQRGGRLFLSDLFRSFDMQLQSHMDFVNGKKKAFSPSPGGSLHEAAAHSIWTWITWAWNSVSSGTWRDRTG
jgi:hypothetical protein